MKTALGVIGILALLIGGLAGILALQRRNHRLHVWLASTRRADEVRRAAATTAPVEPAKPAIGPSRPTADLAAELTKVRADIAAAEARAAAEYARRLSAPWGTNPEEAMTRLEDLHNVGQATPALAFQTLAWAGLHGDAALMASSIEVAPDALPDAEALVAALPPAERAKYPDARALVALFLAKGFVNLSGIQIVDTRFRDGQDAEITVRGLVHADQHLPMRLGPNGWQLWEGKPQIAWLRGELAKGR